jgi:CubicO group peptidase (beta-lactamase class C family)
VKIGTIDPTLLEKNLTNRIEEDVRSQRVCGAAVAVLQNGKQLYRGFFGAQCPGQNKPLREDAVFRIASMTKPVTAVAVLIQAQRGKLKLEDPVALYLPEYANITVGAEGRPCRTPLQIWHLLTHTSGMEGDPDYRQWSKDIPAERQRTLKEGVQCYLEHPLSFEPGTLRRYSGRAAFDVLGRIVEITSGVDFATFVQEEIVAPCGMVDTTFAPNADQWSRMVGMHYYRDGRGILVETTPGCVVDSIPVTHPLGGSGLISTLDDYIRFAQMLQNQGVTEKGRILDASWIRLMATPQLAPELMNEKVNQGLGVRVIVGESYPHLAVGSYGWSGAYGTHFWVDPVNGITAVYLKNSRYDGGSGSLTGKHFEEDIYNSIL